MKYRLSVFLIFLGSVFLTSGKFVDAHNTLKFYFTIFAVFGLIITISLKNNILKSKVQKPASLSILKGLFIVGVLQAIYGILQYIGKYPSNHSNFAITGSFENPAGFVAVISLLFPIGVIWCITSKRSEQRLVFISLGLILLSIILSGSRTGILSVIFSTLLVLVVKFRFFSKIRDIKHIKLIMLSTIIVLLLGSFILYKWREDSANGRLLIWRVSTEMIKDKPLLGYGYKGFQSNYMDYQARYFKSHLKSKYSQLADNMKHPFNEFIKIAVNFGIIGLLFYLSFLGIILWRILKTQSFNREILLAIYTSFIILSCFSYPLKYVPVWFLLGYCTLVLFTNSIPSKQVSLAGKVLITGICMAGMALFSLRMFNEIKWKTIAKKSLQGQTKQMLSQYQKLYPHLKHNALFLYNYGAELNVAKQHEESITILKECQEQFSDYDLQILLADNYYHTGDTAKAIRNYQYAANMIPCRFMPLYKLFQIYKEAGQVNMATNYAKEILDKEVKIPSHTIYKIKALAKEYLNRITNYE